MRVEVIGAEELYRTMAGAARALERLRDTNAAAASLVAAAAVTRAPRRSGVLAGSIEPFDVTNKGAAIGSGVIYSGVQEYGWAARNIRPHRYLSGAVEATDVTPVYAAFVDQCLDDIRGA